MYGGAPSQINAGCSLNRWHIGSFDRHMDCFDRHIGSFDDRIRTQMDFTQPSRCIPAESCIWQHAKAESCIWQHAKAAYDNTPKLHMATRQSCIWQHAKAGALISEPDRHFYANISYRGFVRTAAATMD